MKVSKVIREFIEEQVDMKAKQSKTIIDLKEKADKAEQNFLEEKNKLRDECAKIWKETVRKYNISDKYNPSVSLSGVFSSDLPEVIAYNKACAELHEKKRLAVLNIIAEMELGGTKAELTEKLNNLTF